MKSFFISIFVLFPTLCVAQSPVSHKTYSGPFPQEHSYGKADYYYLTSESGERIFDGHFKYNSGFESLEGNFKNNRQVGKWIRVRPNNASGPKALVKTVTTVDFGENGYIDGHFKIQEHYRNGTIIDIMDATYRNGRLNGPFKGKVMEGNFSGQYKNGIPTGMWKYSWIDFPVDFDKAGSFGDVPVRIVNPATGDIKEEYQSMPTYPEYQGRPREWWIGELQMRDSRMIAFKPHLPAEMSDNNRRYSRSGTRIRGFDGKDDVLYDLGFVITTQLLNNEDECPGGNWDNFLLCNFELPIDEIGDVPVTVNLLLDINGDGKVELIEKDSTVSDKLNDETLRLLQKLQWSFGRGEKKAKAGLRAYCDVKVTFDPDEMNSNLSLYNERKRKKQEQLERGNRSEEGHQIDGKIYDKPDEMPQYPGGQAALTEFISRTLHYPASAADNFIEGNVIVNFVVLKDGTISDVKIQKGRDKDLDQEAMRVVKAMPKLIPGKVNGEPVNVNFFLPIIFRLRH